jgi:hypothetical protein
VIRIDFIRKGFVFVAFSAALVFACQPKKMYENHLIVKGDSIMSPAALSGNALEEILATVPKHAKPVFGYRFSVVGDFNGDGKKERLKERFVSGITNQETNKFYDSIDNYDQLVALTIEKAPISYVVAEDGILDTLHITAAGQMLGLALLKNEGDLNGDGTDELSYVVYWADWSSVNTWHIVTYKNNAWQELDRFSIRDWQLPGSIEDMSSETPDSLAVVEARKVKSFKGLVTKVKPGVIRIHFMNRLGDEVDSVVNLAPLK